MRRPNRVPPTVLHIVWRTVLLTGVLALATVCTAGPANAGGPTSVLLSVPGDGRVAALHHTGADYASLAELVGLMDPATASSRSERTHESDQVVTLTWLIHDVQVWRVDRVHLGASDRPWVETRHLFDHRSVWEAPAVWHQADRGLASLLERVVPDSAVATFAGSPTLDLAPDSGPAVGDTPPSPGVSVTWAGAGLLAGAALVAGTTGMMRLRRHRRPARLDDPKAMTDQLAWP